MQIVCESFEVFKGRVMCCFDSVATELIDHTIKKHSQVN